MQGRWSRSPAPKRVPTTHHERTMTTPLEALEILDLRIGTVLSAAPFAEARVPAIKLEIDFGPDVGVKRSSAQLTWRYEPGVLIGRQVVAAVNLGTRAIECVPGLKGYVGVDLVLGDAADGSQDFAIEINPRLTTSYVGLRAIAEFNIAEAMLQIARGEAPPKMRWKAVRVRFEPDGMVAPVDQV